MDALVQWRCGASAHAHAHARKGRTARAGDRGGRWRRIVLGDVLAEHVLTRTKRQGPPVSGRRGSGSFGSGRTAGYGIGEGRTSPWLEAIAGIRRRSYPRLGSKPVPAPRTRYEVRDMSPSGFLTSSRDRLKHPLPNASKCVRPRVCAGQGVRGVGPPLRRQVRPER